MSGELKTMKAKKSRNTFKLFTKLKIRQNCLDILNLN